MQRTLSESITAEPVSVEPIAEPAAPVEPTVLVEPGEVVSTEELAAAKPAKPAKKARRETKGEDGAEATKKAKKEGKGEPKPTRGPARPYRKLPQETLDSRIQKLEKRMKRTASQAEEAGAFLSKYVREQDFRKADLAKLTTAEASA